MDISFVLPKPTYGIMGGYKVVYEYANRLVKCGHRVTIYYDTQLGKNVRRIPSKLFFFLETLVAKREPSWFQLNPLIKKRAIYQLCDSNIQDADVIFATAVTTAKGVSDLSDTKGKKLYLIQDFENWSFSDAEVYETYSYKDFINITVSQYLKTVVEQKSKNKVVCIPNGLDFECLGMSQSIEDRNDTSVSFLYHTAEFKGTKFSVQAVIKLKEMYPDMQAHCFGSCERPKSLPSWIEYTARASRAEVKEILNRSSVFICSTINEGFGLTGAESMACGCVLATTDYPAVFEYAVDGVNCMVAPVGDVDKMVSNVSYLFNNRAERIEMAKRAERDIHKLNWDVSVQRLLDLIDEQL